MVAEIKALIHKEVLLEWRQKFAFNGVLLYIISTVFVGYLAFEGIIETRSWNALFWIILLFASINAILKSFLMEREGRMLYYYTLSSPQGVINAKIIYNAVLMSVLSMAGYLVFSAFMGDVVENKALFFLNMFFGIIGFSAVLSMVSAIASKAMNNFTLMAVLSFPLVLPLLLVLIRVSGAAMQGAGITDHLSDLFIILLLTGITLVLSNLLFPYIWKE